MAEAHSADAFRNVQVSRRDAADNRGQRVPAQRLLQELGKLGVPVWNVRLLAGQGLNYHPQVRERGVDLVRLLELQPLNVGLGQLLRPRQIDDVYHRLLLVLLRFAQVVARRLDLDRLRLLVVVEIEQQPDYRVAAARLLVQVGFGNRSASLAFGD